jgi:hypothetical protein
MNVSIKSVSRQKTEKKHTGVIINIIKTKVKINKHINIIKINNHFLIYSFNIEIIQISPFLRYTVLQYILKQASAAFEKQNAHFSKTPVFTLRYTSLFVPQTSGIP